MKIEAGSRSDVGRVRKSNQDSLGVYRPADGQERALKGELFLVADGMGGHVSGDIASRQAIESVIRTYSTMPGDDVRANLIAAVQQANADIFARSGGQEGPIRMGTTCVGAVLRNAELHIVNVGDSRAYRVRNGRVEQLSRDHSIVADQVAKGLVDPEQARHLTYRNQITRALGQKGTVEVDYFPHTLQPGDIIILCTDGLSGQVRDIEIAEVVTHNPPDQAAGMLVDMANQRGGPDNISVIVATALPDTAASVPRLAPPAPAAGRTNPPAARAAPRSKLARYWPLALVGIAAIIFFALLAVAVLAFANTNKPPAARALPSPGRTQVPVVATVSAPTTPTSTLPVSGTSPTGTPAIRPIQIEADLGKTSQLNGVAQELGYDSALQMVSQNPLQGSGLSVMPRKPGILVVAQARNSSGSQGCNLLIAVGQTTFTISCPAGGWPNAGGMPRENDTVRVLGLLNSTDEQWTPVMIDIFKTRPGATGPEWANWYRDKNANRRIWAYTISGAQTVDAQSQGLAEGERLLVYAEWKSDMAQAAQIIRLLRLTNDHYPLTP